MEYTVTLRSVDRGKPELVGSRAMDLAILQNKSILIPLAFVIKANAMQRFIQDNNLSDKMNKLREEKQNVPDDEIEGLFLAGQFSKELQEELDEAYESIFVSEENITATHLVKNDKEPDLLLIPSPDYRPSNTMGLRRSYGTRQDFIRQVKSCWAHYHKNVEGHDRKELGINEFNLAIIVQRQVHEELSAETDVMNDAVEVRAYYGMNNYLGQQEYDLFKVDKNSLSIVESEINHQNHKLSPGPEGTEEVALHESGEKQKADDKQVVEAARIAKRVSSYLERESRLWFGFKKMKTYLFFTDPYIAEAQIERVEEAEAMTIPEPVKTDDAVKEPRAMGQELDNKIVVEAPEEFVFYPEMERGESENENAPESIPESNEVEQENNFILTIPESEILGEDKADPDEILSNGLKQVGIQSMHAITAIRQALLDYCTMNNIQVGDQQSLTELADLIPGDVPYKNELERLDNLGGEISIEEVRYAYRLAEKFLREFR